MVGLSCLAAPAAKLSPTSGLGVGEAKCTLFRRGNGGDGICGNGDDSGVSGDGGRVVRARSLSISSI
ncbi:hypothetical protein Tco_1025720, partial [Tanacetum coccineum]